MGKLYKILVDGKSCHGGNYAYPLPLDDKPGEWTPEQPVKPCSSGYHLTTRPNIWLSLGMTVYDAEGRGIMENRGYKFVFESVRLLKVSDYQIPEYWKKFEEFMDGLKNIAWMSRKGEVKKEWKHFEHMNDAWKAARNASWNAANVFSSTLQWSNDEYTAYESALDDSKDASLFAGRWNAWDAARVASWNHKLPTAAYDARYSTLDTSLCARICIVSDLEYPNKSKHEAHANERMEVWRRGYGLARDVNGVLFTYDKP